MELTFNRTADEIRDPTETLNRVVGERARELERTDAAMFALNARLSSENLHLAAEVAVARRFQQLVLPKPCELRSIPRIEIAAFMQPANEVGGDYYDVLHSDARLKVGIGDVTGHGLESGMLMLMVQSMARALYEAGVNDPQVFLNDLNRALVKNIQRTASEKHLSLAFLDFTDREVVLSGQHEDVIIVRSCGDVEVLETVDLGFPIGLEPDIAGFVASKAFPFREGDIIVLFTDGVTEAVGRNGDMFGTKGLCEAVLAHRTGSAEQIKDGVISDLLAFIGQEQIHDDITLVIVRHK
ncbi:PP2C family protein-serine/threonine phosphatase [Inquilinus limosus]|uniref:PP2C family protein-serine/threonine phosphatase n=1 Tax=Inquilinus limosus TaxID=171674 RepID=UPI003F17E8BE